VFEEGNTRVVSLGYVRRMRIAAIVTCILWALSVALSVAIGTLACVSSSSYQSSDEDARGLQIT